MENAFKPMNVLTVLAVSATAVLVLVKGSEILIPLAIAVMVWYLLNAFSRELKSRTPGGHKIPDLAWTGISLLILLGIQTAVLNLLLQSLAGINEAVPVYQKNIHDLVSGYASMLGVDASLGMERLTSKIDLKWAVTTVGGLAATVAGDVGLIFIYVLFLVLEQKSFDKKVRMLIADPDRQKRMAEILGRIQSSIRAYIFIKTLMCALVGVLTYVLLKALGVHFAFFLAFVAFVANYAPTVGSVVGVALPALMTAVQFPGSMPWIMVMVFLTTVHMVVGNILEPKLMGGKLNISPFVVILSLVVWGKIWGVTGMVLCVPLTIIAIIVMSNFTATRPIALLLTEDGRLDDIGGLEADGNTGQ